MTTLCVLVLFRHLGRLATLARGARCVLHTTARRGAFNNELGT
jgi:hypothetical protein